MRSVFLYNTNNFVGESLVGFFSNNDQNTVLIADKFSAEKLQKNIQDENIFILNSQFFDEKNLLDLEPNYSTILCNSLNKIFESTQNIVKLLTSSNKPGKLIFITVTPSLNNIFDADSTFPTAPIHDEAIHSFVKSLSKEISPFNITTTAISLEPIFEMLDKETLKTYRKKMKVYAIKKSPMKINELMTAVEYIASNNSHLFSGKVHYLGEGME